MLISELSLRSLIREMLIIEGYKDDQRALIEKYPDSATTINHARASSVEEGRRRRQRR
jgi:hypothetical protein